jgi:hypothetical protein
MGALSTRYQSSQLDPYHTSMLGFSDHLLPNLKRFELVDHSGIMFQALLTSCVPDGNLEVLCS